MFFARDNTTYSEDMFEDTRMTFGEHLEELRLHLWKAIFGFLIALVLSFFIGKPVLQFIAAPVEQQLGKFYDDRVEKIQEQLVGGDKDLEALNAKPIDLKITLNARELAEQILPAKDAEAVAPDKRI